MTLKAKQAKKTYKKFESEKPVKQILYYGYSNVGRWRKPLWGDYSKVEIDRVAIEESLKAREEYLYQKAREAFFTKKPTA